MAFFKNVIVTGAGNLTVTASKTGYIHSSMNITVDTSK